MIIDQAFRNEPVTVIDHGFSVSSKAKTPCVWIDFQFDGMEGPGGEPITVKAYLYLSDAAIQYTLEKLGNLGWHGKSIDELDPNDQTHYNFKGAKALITGKMEEYEGKMRPKVDFINDPNYSPDMAIDPKDRKVLGSKLNAKIAAFRAKNKAPGATATTNGKAVAKAAYGKKEEPVEVEANGGEDSGIPS